MDSPIFFLMLLFSLKTYEALASYCNLRENTIFHKKEYLCLSPFLTQPTGRKLHIKWSRQDMNQGPSGMLMPKHGRFSHLYYIFILSMLITTDWGKYICRLFNSNDLYVYFFCQYYVLYCNCFVLYIEIWCYDVSSILLLLINIVLGIQNLFCFHMSFKMIFSR